MSRLVTKSVNSVRKQTELYEISIVHAPVICR